MSLSRWMKQSGERLSRPAEDPDTTQNDSFSGCACEVYPAPAVRENSLFDSSSEALTSRPRPSGITQYVFP
jgi:hypothetical protein